MGSNVMQSWINRLGMFAAGLFTLSTAALAQEATELGGEPGGAAMKNALGVDLFAMLKHVDLVGVISLVILAIFSVLSTMVIIYKALQLRQAGRQTDAFVKACAASSGALEEAYRNANRFPDSPLAEILREAYLDLEVENWYQNDSHVSLEARIEIAKTSVERVFERTISNEIVHLESWMVFLAITTNVCPFIGLFGTVWGVMAAFQSIGMTESAQLSTLAPGISTGLLATVGGLICAIPSSLAYNYFTHRIQSLISRMDAFALELSNIIHKQIVKQSAPRV
jgi:biopolymer transport protein TolQ